MSEVLADSGLEFVEVGHALGKFSVAVDDIGGRHFADIIVYQNFACSAGVEYRYPRQVLGRFLPYHFVVAY